MLLQVPNRTVVLQVHCADALPGHISQCYVRVEHNGRWQRTRSANCSESGAVAWVEKINLSNCTAKSAITLEMWSERASAVDELLGKMQLLLADLSITKLWCAIDDAPMRIMLALAAPNSGTPNRASKPPVPPKPAVDPEPALSDGPQLAVWEVCVSRSTGDQFYYNTETGESTYETPDAVLSGATHANGLEVTPDPFVQPENAELSIEQRGRLTQLLRVFLAFDADGSGFVEVSELMQLGAMRQQLGQTTDEWTEEKNAQLLNRMDTNQDGCISGSEFCSYFETTLPRNQQAFDVVVAQFMQVAEACRGETRVTRISSKGLAARLKELNTQSSQQMISSSKKGQDGLRLSSLAIGQEIEIRTASLQQERSSKPGDQVTLFVEAAGQSLGLVLVEHSDGTLVHDADASEPHKVATVGKLLSAIVPSDTTGGMAAWLLHNRAQMLHSGCAGHMPLLGLEPQQIVALLSRIKPPYTLFFEGEEI